MVLVVLFKKNGEFIGEKIKEFINNLTFFFLSILIILGVRKII